MNYFILLHLATMMLARHVPCYYLRSFQKNASHGSYDEMLLTTNERWNYFITLPPAARENVLPVSSQSPMHRRLRDNVIIAVVVVNRAVAINVIVVVIVVVVH